MQNVNMLLTIWGQYCIFGTVVYNLVYISTVIVIDSNDEVTEVINLKIHETGGNVRKITLDKFSQKYKGHIAYDYLLESIISGKFPPEKPLNEREICETLGVSRTPVREALRRLTSEGLAESYPGRGVFVSSVSLEKSLEMHELKEGLERMAARLCTVRMSDDEIHQLWACLKDHTRAFQKGEMATTADLDLRFHVLMIEGAHNSMMEQQAKSILLRTRRLSQLSVLDPNNTSQFIEQHTNIFEAIQARNAGAAEHAVSVHIEEVKKFQQESWHLLF